MTGAELISHERRLQIVDGVSSRDDELTEEELVHAAIVYASTTKLNVLDIAREASAHGWPFADESYRPFRKIASSGLPEVDRVRCLAKAGALLAAEIDRLTRECKE